MKHAVYINTTLVKLHLESWVRAYVFGLVSVASLNLCGLFCFVLKRQHHKHQSHSGIPGGRVHTQLAEGGKENLRSNRRAKRRGAPFGQEIHQDYSRGLGERLAVRRKAVRILHGGRVNAVTAVDYYCSCVVLFPCRLVLSVCV